MLAVARQLRDLMGRGLTQGDIADRVGLTQPTISRLMTGVIGDIRSASAARIKDLHDAVVSGALPKPKYGPRQKPRKRGA